MRDQTIKKYIAEMDRRFEEMESGKIKGIKLAELEAGARQSYKSRKQKNKTILAYNLLTKKS